MNVELLKLSLVNSFGKKSSDPVRAAAAKILIAAAGALFFGVVLALSIAKAKLPHDLPEWWLGIVVLCLMAITTALISLLMQSVTGQNQRTNNSLKILNVLPVQRNEKWFAYVLPQASIVCFILLFSLPIVAAVSTAMHAIALLLLTAAFMGALAGLGFALMPYKSWLKFGALVSYTVGTGKLLEVIMTTEKKYVVVALSLSICIVTIGALAGYLFSYKSELGRLDSTSAQVFGQLGSRSVGKLWFFLKLLRNRRTVSSLLLCLMISSTFAGILALKGLSRLGGLGLIIFAASISTAYTADVRGISRRFKTLEVAGVNGVGYFIYKEVVSVFILAMSINIPLLLLAIQARAGSIPGLALLYIATQFAAVCLGLCASTVFVPETGDIGGQFFAATLGVSAIVLVPKALHFGTLDSLTHIAVGWLMVGLLGLLGIYVIESLRRRHYANA